MRSVFTQRILGLAHCLTHSGRSGNPCGLLPHRVIKIIHLIFHYKYGPAIHLAYILRTVPRAGRKLVAYFLISGGKNKPPHLSV